jgi:cobyrinic acid a,c-diamide synthase
MVGGSLPRVVVAGTHSGVGKTTVASGLMAAFAREPWDLRVAPFKVGPDFIDPSYHALAAGRPGRNLDAFLSGPELVPQLFAHGSRGADVALVEGVMGLFDGKSDAGEHASTAHVAKLLDAPVILVVDASAMARSAAAMVHGYATFDSEVRLGGVILNRVGSKAHEKMLREAIAPLNVPVLGVLRREAEIRTPDRHLGLVPVPERPDEARAALDAATAAISRSCDLHGILRITRSAGRLDAKRWTPEAPDPGPPARVAVAAGPSFSFLYEENLELLRGAGAETTFFDPTSDEDLPEGTDALYLGGGFPETYAEALAANEPLTARVRRLAAEGRPVVAECGGLLYLVEELDGHRMCGVFAAKARMTNRLTLGYREARSPHDSPLAAVGTHVRGHEFHYSALEPGLAERPAWELEGRGPEGFASDGVHASYLHLHWAATPELPRRLVRAASMSARVNAWADA